MITLPATTSQGGSNGRACVRTQLAMTAGLSFSLCVVFELCLAFDEILNGLRTLSLMLVASMPLHLSSRLSSVLGMSLDGDFNPEYLPRSGYSNVDRLCRLVLSRDLRALRYRQLGRRMLGDPLGSTEARPGGLRVPQSSSWGQSFGHSEYPSIRLLHLSPMSPRPSVRPGTELGLPSLDVPQSSLVIPWLIPVSKLYHGIDFDRSACAQANHSLGSGRNAPVPVRVRM